MKRSIFFIAALSCIFISPRDSCAGSCSRKALPSETRYPVRVCPYAVKKNQADFKDAALKANAVSSKSSAVDKKYSAQEIRKRQQEFRKKALKNNDVSAQVKKRQDEMRRKIEQNRLRPEKRVADSAGQEPQPDEPGNRSQYWEELGGSAPQESNYWDKIF